MSINANINIYIYIIKIAIDLCTNPPTRVTLQYSLVHCDSFIRMFEVMLYACQDQGHIGIIYDIQ